MYMSVGNDGSIPSGLARGKRKSSTHRRSHVVGGENLRLDTPCSDERAGCVWLTEEFEDEGRANGGALYVAGKHGRLTTRICG